MSGVMAVVAVIVLALVLRAIAAFFKNASASEETEAAAVLRKNASSRLDPATNIWQQDYEILFAIGEEGKETLRCAVSFDVYERIPEGARGQLTHQGQWFRAFTFDGQTVEKRSLFGG